MIEVFPLLQISIFMDATDVTVSPDIVSRYFDILKDKGFLPNILHEIGPDFPGPQPRLGFATKDNTWRIAVLAKRLNIEQHLVAFASGDEVDSFVEEAKTIATIMLDELKRHGIRLAFICNALLKELSPETLTQVCNKLLNPMEFYKSEEIFEWGYNTVLHQDMEINDHTETTNVITNIKRIKGTLSKLDLGTTKEFDTLGFNFDLNTVTENKETRFGISELEVFIDNAVNTYNAISEQLQGLLNE